MSNLLKIFLHRTCEIETYHTFTPLFSVTGFFFLLQKWKGCSTLFLYSGQNRDWCYLPLSNAAIKRELVVLNNFISSHSAYAYDPHQFPAFPKINFRWQRASLEGSYGYSASKNGRAFRTNGDLGLWAGLNTSLEWRPLRFYLIHFLCTDSLTTPFPIHKQWICLILKRLNKRCGGGNACRQSMIAFNHCIGWLYVHWYMCQSEQKKHCPDSMPQTLVARHRVLPLFQSHL